MCTIVGSGGRFRKVPESCCVRWCRYQGQVPEGSGEFRRQVPEGSGELLCALV